MSYNFTQICYSVRDYKKATENWVRVTGAGPFYLVHSDVLKNPIYRGQPAQDRFTSAMGFAGDTLIEFVQPLNDEPSIYQEVLQSRGDMAVNHVYPRLRPLSPEEYDAQYAAYVEAGYESALSFTIDGIGRNDFFDATRDFGCFFELLEIQPDTYEMLLRMHRSHLEWNGERIIRDFGELAA